MKKLFALLVGAVTVLGLTGCFEQAGLLNVDKDGSGTLKLRMYMSPQMMEQMNSLGGLAEGLGGEAGGAADPMSQFKDQLKTQGESSGATFVSGKDVKNKAGWSGYEATFKFADVTKLVLGDDAGEEDAGGAGGYDEAHVGWHAGDPNGSSERRDCGNERQVSSGQQQEPGSDDGHANGQTA